MKRIIMFVLLFAALKVAGQTTGYLRFDTVKIMKQNGTCELYLINKTKDSLGLLTNVGGGLTRFIKSKAINDSSIVVGLDTLVIRGASGGAPTPSWQQTLNVSPNTYGRLVFDTSFTKPTTEGTSVEHTWFKFMPLVKADDTANTPFYFNQSAGLNLGVVNEVVTYGINMGPGGGAAISGRPAIGHSIEGYYNTLLGRYQEMHDYYVDRAGIQYRLGSYTINTDAHTANYYHSIDNFSLRNFGAAGANTPYFTIQGTANLTEAAWINNSDQTEYFGTSANFNQDVNTANFTLGANSGKPSNLFNLANFSNAFLPSSDFAGLGYDGAQITFTGATTGVLARLLVDSSQTMFSSFTNVPMRFMPNNTQALDLRSNRVNLYQPTGVGAGVSTPIAQLDVRSSAQDQNIYSESSKAGGYSAIFVASNGAGGNVGIQVNANGGTGNKGVEVAAAMSLFDYGFYSNGLAKVYVAGKVGLNTTTPTWGLDIQRTIGANKDSVDYQTTTGARHMLVIDTTTGKFQRMDIPAGGGITSINGHTGSAITVQGGTALSVDNSTPNTVTFNVTPNSSALPHTLDAVYTTAGNTGTGETDLFTYTLPAGELAIDGRTMNFEIDGEFNDNTITAQLKLYFGGNVTLNTGAVSVSTAFSKWRIKGYIMRTSSSTAHVTYEMHAPGLATPVFLSYNNLTSLDFTTTNVFKISAQAAGGGASNSDITAHSWQLLYKPQPQ